MRNICNCMVHKRKLAIPFEACVARRKSAKETAEWCGCAMVTRYYLVVARGAAQPCILRLWCQLRRLPTLDFTVFSMSAFSLKGALAAPQVNAGLIGTWILLVGTGKGYGRIEVLQPSQLRPFRSVTARSCFNLLLTVTTVLILIPLDSLRVLRWS